MKILIFSIAFILFSVFGHEPILPASQNTFSVEEPYYAKWGRIAVEKAKERYPEADIADYLYIGRRKADKSTTETFKLWIRESDKEFGVFIIIEFESETEKVKRIEFIETLS